MSIIDSIQKNLTQTIVYWGNPTEDGYGGLSFDDPVEINGRWEQVSVIQKDDKGEDVLVKARCYLEQDVEQGGYLYLGSLDDFDSSAAAPIGTSVVNALRILSFSKVPRLGRTDEFIRIVSLHMTNN